jgi:hypothetical protein
LASAPKRAPIDSQILTSSPDSKCLLPLKFMCSRKWAKPLLFVGLQHGPRIHRQRSDYPVPGQPFDLM